VIPWWTARQQRCCSVRCCRWVAQWLKAALQLVHEDGFGYNIPEAKKSLYGSSSFATETKGSSF